MQSQDFNSATNQNIKSKFVGREVYCCLTDMVEDLIETGKIDIYEHLEFYGTTESGDEYTEQERDEKLEELNSELRNEVGVDWGMGENEPDYIPTEKTKGIRKQIEELENMEFDQLPEIYEWWGVSSFLADKLREQGEVVVDEYLVSIWGRQATGQAILLDSVISRICNDMEILEGQRNDWSK